MEKISPEYKGGSQEISGLQDIESSFLMPEEAFDRMITGEDSFFGHAGLSPDFYMVGEVEAGSRIQNVDCLYSQGGKSYLGSHIIKRPSRYGTWLASIRGKQPQVHVSYEIRELTPDEAFDFTHLAFEPTLDISLPNKEA